MSNKNDDTTELPERRVGFGALVQMVALVIGFGLLPLSVLNEEEGYRVAFGSILAVLALLATLRFIPSVMPLCLQRGIAGRDINKTVSYRVPEALGIVPATVFLVTTVLFQPFLPFFDQELLGQYNAALTSTCFMVFLGFADDVLDLRWRIKIFTSFLATLPLLVAYNGATTIVLPSPINDMVGLTHVNLGMLYLVYMALMGVFCTNSINIFAGVNGLEAGQSLVIACAVLVHNVLEMDGEDQAAHVLSFFFVLPFMAVTMGLLFFNWYPSRVFVGDTYTYFAGMTLAVAGILGHFTKTLMLFFAPQILNFVISFPQLFNTRWLPCPRHRLPKYNPKTGLLEAVPTNWTLINLFLWVFGPMREDQVTKGLLCFQTLCCLAGLAVRHYFAQFFFNA